MQHKNNQYCFTRCVCVGLVAFAGSAFANSRLAIRSGMLMGNMSGGAEISTFSVTTIPYFDIEYERLQTAKSSFVFRGILALPVGGDQAGVVKYAYGGLGQRFYFSGTPIPIEASEKGFSISAQPKISYSIGWDAGLNTTSYRQFGAVYLTSTGAAAGITLQMHYYLFGSVAINLGAGVQYFFGMTDFSATGMPIMGFVGASF